MVPALEERPSSPSPEMWRVTDPDCKTRAAEMALSTWNAIQTSDGTFHRYRRCSLTYVETSAKTLKGLDATVAVVSLSTGFGFALMSISPSAATAVSASATVGVLFALLAMPVFKLARDRQKHRKLESRIAEIEQGWFDSPAVDDQDLADAAIVQIFKEGRRIGDLLKLIVGQRESLREDESLTKTLGAKDFREVTDAADFKDRMEIYFPRRIAKKGKLPADGLPLNVEIATRLARLENYREWLGAYFFVLRNASLELRGEQFLRLEKWIHDSVETQVSMRGSHGNCAREFCLGPAPYELIRSEVDPRRKTLVQTLYRDILTNARMQEFPLAPAPARDRDDALEDEVRNVASRDKSRDERGAVSFMIDRAIRQGITSFNSNRSIQRYGGAFRNLIDAGDTAGLEREMEDVWQGGIGAGQVSRALTMCTSHYPKNIEKSLKRLQEVVRNLDRGPIRKLSPFANCTEAHAATRHLLKINHYVERQLAHLGMLEMAMKEVRNSGPYYED